MSALVKFLRMTAGLALLAGVALGLIVVVFAPFEIYRKALAEEWPSRKGVVTLSVASHRSNTRGLRVASSWTPAICGTYKDNGEKFCISRVRYGEFGWESSALEAVARYPVGREVDVYFSPHEPAVTILEAVSPWTQIVAVLGLGLGCLLLPVVLWALRARVGPRRHGRG